MEIVISWTRSTDRGTVRCLLHRCFSTIQANNQIRHFDETTGSSGVQQNWIFTFKNKNISVPKQMQAMMCAIFWWCISKGIQTFDGWPFLEAWHMFPFPSLKQHWIDTWNAMHRIIGVCRLKHADQFDSSIYTNAKWTYNCAPCMKSPCDICISDDVQNVFLLL